MKNDPGKMPRSMGGTPETDTGPKRHPNGGGTRPAPKPSGKMKRKMGGAPEQGAALDVGQDSSSGLGKMPRTVKRPPQNEPFLS